MHLEIGEVNQLLDETIPRLATTWSYIRDLNFGESGSVFWWVVDSNNASAHFWGEFAWEIIEKQGRGYESHLDEMNNLFLIVEQIDLLQSSGKIWKTWIDVQVQVFV